MFKPTAQSNLFPVRYSAFLGAMYLETPEAAESFKAVKASIGEAEVKKGFQGNSGDNPSAKALKELAAKGVQFGSMIGNLTGARIVMRDVQGRQTPYLGVTVTSDEGKFYLSTSAGQKGAQMLIRKLANATPGAATELGMFATYGQKEGADRAYADHGASLRQNGTEVKGVSPTDGLSGEVSAAMAALTAAGVEDKETRNKRRAAVELDYHVRLMAKVTEKFTAFYSATGLPADDHDGETIAQPGNDDPI